MDVISTDKSEFERMDSMLDSVIKKIAEQQKGKENTAVYMVGEQLKDICKKIPEAAEIVLRDLKLPEMSIEKAEKKIHEYADKQKRIGNCVCVPPNVAENIIKEFYGLTGFSEPAAELPPESAKNTSRKMIDLADFL